MATDTYVELYYHFVWSTKNRNPLITLRIEELLFAYMRQKCDELRVFVYALNGTEDHVHIACSLPTSLSVSDFLEAIKGSSAHYINHLGDATYFLAWQPGYGALTFTKRDLPRISAYIENQKPHHAKGEMIAKLEHCSTTPSSPPSAGFLRQ